MAVLISLGWLLTMLRASEKVIRTLSKRLKNHKCLYIAFFITKIVTKRIKLVEIV